MDHAAGAALETQTEDQTERLDGGLLQTRLNRLRLAFIVGPRVVGSPPRGQGQSAMICGVTPWPRALSKPAMHEAWGRSTSPLQ